ncbi:MAG: hypothetical protein HC810_01450 [Acaryochloridaceae cyanobacterium RL_2_7]|nr:hypothetical protein [Acaryochloridaceae cyanobacterium RL_2_7]
MNTLPRNFCQSTSPWGSAELETALDLRSSIIGLVLQKADELAKVNLELARSNEDLASFAYVASHDLKAPLRGIANLACWIQEDLEGKVSAQTQTQLDLLQTRVYRMHDMIQGLLQYSRVGENSESIGMVSIPELLREILDSLAPPSSIHIELPEIQTLYETNKTLLKQVLTNLLSNAIKYMHRSDGKISIQVQDENGLRFSVTDNGPGIAPEYHEKIFQMFQTLHSRDEIEGTGIGLAIVKK